MSDSVFSMAALEHLAQVIGDSFTGAQLTNLMSKAGYSEYSHNGQTKWRWVYSVFEDLQAKNKSWNHVLKILTQATNPEEFIWNIERGKSILSGINSVLMTYGLKIDNDGITLLKIPIEKQRYDGISQNRKEFINRGFHEKVINHSLELFCEDNYFHAVFESCKALDKYIAEKAKIDDSGRSLAGKALSLTGPLKINKQGTESEKGEQEGLMHLCMGLMAAIRNPQAHEPELDWKIDKRDSLEILTMVSYLFRQIDKAIYFSSSPK